MYLRGKQEVTEVFRAEWQPSHDSDATVMGVSMFKAGGADSVAGGLSNDVFVLGNGLDANDSIAGGLAYDTVRLSGNYNLVFGASTVTGVETFQIGHGNVQLTLDAGIIA